MQNTLVNVNGEILAWDQARVSVFDRSYLYGDSLYEVARSYQGNFFGLTEHLERLENSAALCHMKLDQSTRDYEREIQATFKKFRDQPGMSRADAYCRIVVSRGMGRIGFGLKSVLTPSQYVIIMQPITDFTTALTAPHFQEGLKLQISPRLRNDRRALDPAMKSGNYLNSVLSYLDAVDAGFDDALLCDAEGHLTEGTTFNIFYVRRGIVATPPLEVGILDGITRRLVIQLGRAADIEVREVRFPRERLYEADEVFASSSIKEVWPVTRVDSVRIGNGRPGTVTIALAELLRKEIARRTGAQATRFAAPRAERTL